MAVVKREVGGESLNLQAPRLGDVAHDSTQHAIALETHLDRR